MAMARKYLKMIRGIRPNTADERTWSVYILRCGDDSFYTGVAKVVEARLAKHNAGRGAAYTRSRRPVRLLYREDGLTRSEALIREAGIKSLPRARKKLLVAGPGRSLAAPASARKAGRSGDSGGSRRGNQDTPHARKKALRHNSRRDRG